VQQHVSGINSLRDVNINMLNKYVQPHNNEVYQRCRFVVEEIERLQEACIDLEKNDIEAFGIKMFETHEGLSHLYEVSCAELDFLVDHVRHNLQ
jgi:galactokinase